MDGDIEVPDMSKLHNNRFVPGLGGFGAPGTCGYISNIEDGIGAISQ